MKDKLLSIYRALYRSFGPQDWWPGDTPFEVAIGAVLTQNTNWGNVEKAISNLKRANALSPVVIGRMPRNRLARLIRSAGYFNVKAARLKSLVAYIIKRYGVSPDMRADKPVSGLREELLAINGVGPETCDSIVLYAFGLPVFVVDAYTRRIFSRHGIVGKRSKYDEIQSLFMDSLPHDAALFNEYHALIVKLGKEHCRPIPICKGCPLARCKLSCK